ncbi:Ger(x)C family spore germination protein [Desulfitobacterium sp.]|uniref:Ger(x)C family spore germination protein n=1 Tax=Desulfitobacterium sp. TaxID=49981 RepID=UPI002B216A51|nr:Ger(x)C family spore germination protein [Desulfitobacterium sp.]MEA4902967.1 Ger(x)C family spore germination protein [Desulfitobacterium sp.]
MKKRSLNFMLCLVLSFTLTGCWNRNELNTLAVIQALGIDMMEDGQINLTIQLLKPGVLQGAPAQTKGEGGGGPCVWIATVKGKTITEAIRNATTQVDRRLFASQNKVVVIGETAAQSGLSPLLDYYFRYNKPRELAYIFVAKGKAEDIINAENEQEKVPGKAIENLAKASLNTSKAPEVTFHDLQRSLVSKTSSSFLPGLELVKRPAGTTIEKQVELCGTAIFKKDKLVGWFDGKESRGLLWVLGKVKSGILVVKSPEDESQKVVLEIIRASSKITPELIDGKPTVTVEVKEEGNLGEQMSSVDLSNPDAFRELEDKQAEAIKEEINAALSKAQEWGVDLFKFGTEYHRKFPAEYPELEKNWEEEFKNMVVNVEIDAKVLREGQASKPIRAEKKTE